MIQTDFVSNRELLEFHGAVEPLTAIDEQWCCNTVLIIRALDLSTKRYVARVFLQSLGKTFSRHLSRAQAVERSLTISLPDTNIRRDKLLREI